MRRRGDDDDSEVNLTPMLDVVFIMLIFFIVTASFVREKGIEINRPDASVEPPPDTENQSILVQITGTDEVRIGPRTVDWRLVRPNIERLLAEDPDRQVVMRVDEGATNGLFVRVWDQTLQAGGRRDFPIALVQPAK